VPGRRKVSPEPGVWPEDGKKGGTAWGRSSRLSEPGHLTASGKQGFVTFLLSVSKVMPETYVYLHAGGLD